MDEPRPAIPQRPGFVGRLFGRLFGAVEPAPEDLAPCEFECRELECSHGRWAGCEHRREEAARARAPEQRP